MEQENIMLGQPDSAEESNACDEATIPETPSDKPQGITLKFNKEIREISFDEAVALAQKGLKFDKVSPELERIKNLAAKKGLNISDFISEIERNGEAMRRAELMESSGGNEELAEHILNLEKSAVRHNDSFEVLKQEFPEIKSRDELPQEVLEELDLFGGNVLSAYLLYLHRQNNLANESRLRQEQNRTSTLGSQAKNSPEKTSANEEFIKGIWS